MDFFWGDDVEVCSKQDGFLGSYFPATVIAEYGNNTYAVRYKTLVTDDESQPLVEVVGADKIRPEPPVVQLSGFDLYQEVDAFDNDGWWVGKVSGRKGSTYYVFFDTAMKLRTRFLSSGFILNGSVASGFLPGKERSDSLFRARR